MSILELQPKFVCKLNGDNNFRPCVKEQFCGKPDVPYRVDWDQTSSLHNFITRLDLGCAHGSKIALIGSVYYIGTLLGTIAVLLTADYVGRFRIFLLSHTACLVFLIYILFTPSFNMLIFSLAAAGFFQAGRIGGGFIYAYECL